MSQLLYFTAPWCGPCNQLKPQLTQLTLPFTTIDVDTQSHVALKHHVRSIPCFIKLDSDGYELGRLVGSNVTINNIKNL